jgi:hypothetical protein
MLSRRVFGLACAVAVFVCLVAAPVAAQPLDKRTLFTFSGPVTLPGVTLPAGEYLFRLADPNSSSRVAQPRSARAARTELPRTSSPLPLVAMVGTLSLVSAALLQFWRPGRQ